MQNSKIKPTPSGVAPMPEDLSDGRDRIVFANSRDLLDFHQRFVQICTKIYQLSTLDDIL